MASSNAGPSRLAHSTLVYPLPKDPPPYQRSASFENAPQLPPRPSINNIPAQILSPFPRPPVFHIYFDGRPYLPLLSFFRSSNRSWNMTVSDATGMRVVYTVEANAGTYDDPTPQAKIYRAAAQPTLGAGPVRVGIGTATAYVRSRGIEFSVHGIKREMTQKGWVRPQWKAVNSTVPAMGDLTWSTTSWRDSSVGLRKQDGTQLANMRSAGGFGRSGVVVEVYETAAVIVDEIVVMSVGFLLWHRKTSESQTSEFSERRLK